MFIFPPAPHSHYSGSCWTYFSVTWHGSSLKPLRTCSKGSIYLHVTAPPIVQGELECRLPDSMHICSPSQFNSLQLQPCYFCAKIDYAEFKSVCSEMHPVNNLMELIFMSFQSQLFCGSMNGSNDSGEYFGAQ